MEVRDLSLDTIIPYARNPRKNDGAVDKVAASIKEFGWRSPIVVDEEMVILAGHTRYKAAKKLGLTEAPVHIAEGLTEAQKKAYRIADNRVAEEAEWDSDLLKIELEDLGDFNLELTGYDLNELAKLFDSEEIDQELKEESYSEVFNVIVECGDEVEQEKVFNQLNRDGYKCRVQSL
jgi:ParB-like chromosome segregation protein Spo0J